MKIAIVGPSPVPFTVGGVENLLWGLQDWMNLNTDHQVELIKLPSKEENFWNLIETYKSFYKLNLDHFDMVISTKYPAWMVQHRNHICYMQHRLRGLYDTYHFTKLPTTVQYSGFKSVNAVLDYLKTSPSDLSDFFLLLDNLKRDSSVPKELLEFPGPFIREIIHFLDNFALSTTKIKSFHCISKTVKKRKTYFPNIEPTIIHHPSNQKNFEKGSFNHIFIVSRLDAPKRIHLLIEAMAYVKSDIKVYIAGIGPAEAELKRLSKNDPRIQFLGFVTDDEVKKYYKDSLVIPYFPYDEDYGLITIEAMMHGKPVITTEDAGGPTEFVKDYETGFIVPVDPKKIAEKIEFFINNKNEAKVMGDNAYNLVKTITWEKVVSSLLGLESRIVQKNIAPERKKIIVTSTFHIYPPQGGGQARIFHLYKELSRKYNIELLALTSENEISESKEISSHFTESKIPKTKVHAEAEWEIESKVGCPVTDIAMPKLVNLSPKYRENLERGLNDSQIVILSHPYMWNVVKPLISKHILVYEAHNVEFLIKKEMLPKNKTSKELLDLTFQIEKNCCTESDLIMVCSEEDKQAIVELYHISMDKIVVVPNGVDTQATVYTSPTQRIENKKHLGIQKEKVGLFMGSWHGPNLDACMEIIKIAQYCPDIKFLLMGSQCQYLEQKKIKIPNNVGLLGLVSEEQKNKIFSIVDFALNPMLSGSGTNLKMFDYMSAGIPIISTEFGTRGIENKDLFLIHEIEEMAQIIKEFDFSKMSQIIQDSRIFVEKKFDWRVIAEEFSIELMKLDRNIE